jgi:hypothetical protein
MSRRLLGSAGLISLAGLITAAVWRRRQHRSGPRRPGWLRRLRRWCNQVWPGPPGRRLEA